MPSESARATSAAESKFRVNTPNSRPRAAKIIALDAPSEIVAKRLAKERWNGASFLTASKFAGASHGTRFSGNGWLSDLAGRAADLVAEVASADMVIMLGTVGEDTHAAAIIAETCALKQVMTTVLILGSAGQSDRTLNETLAELRPHASMLVIASDEGYLVDMLTALRA